MRIAYIAFVLSLLAPLGFAWALCVQVEHAELKAGMGEKDPVIGEAIRYTPFKKMQKKNGWYQVQDLDSKVYWILESNVTTAYACAVISAPFAYLRTGPGPKHPKTASERGEKYLAFRVLGEENQWVNVEDPDGDEAWISKSLLWMP